MGGPNHSFRECYHGRLGRYLIRMDEAQIRILAELLSISASARKNFVGCRSLGAWVEPE